MTYWIEEMQSPEEIRAALARSNAPFTDNRSDEEIALYSKQQADSRRMRADRSQFERYRQRLGEDAPKSFHTFRRIKNADGQKWKEMQSLYRSKSPKNVDNSGESDIMKKRAIETAGNDVHFVGKIDIEKYRCITEDIQTDEVIITEKQIEHIKERHPNDYERYFNYAKEIIENPDYILEANKPNTAFVLKHIEDNGKNYQLILRLKTSQDPKDYLNSIITFLKVEEKRYNRYLRTKKTLYKSE